MTRQPGLSAYDDRAEFPAIVWQAVELTRRNEFALACMPEVGRLLQLFAAGAARVCELGTAYGVGAAWIAAGMLPDATLLTVEKDPARAAVAKSLFRGRQSVDVLAGDWSLALDRGPFDLLFSDGGPKRAPGDPEKLLPLVRPGTEESSSWTTTRQAWRTIWGGRSGSTTTRTAQSKCRSRSTQR